MENSEESVEDESDEDLTDMPRTSPTQPPYSPIPPPPVWVQHDQGLSERTSTHKHSVYEEVTAAALHFYSFLTLSFSAQLGRTDQRKGNTAPCCSHSVFFKNGIVCLLARYFPSL